MTGFETYIVASAKNIASGLGKWGYASLMKYTSNEYEQELYEVITKTIKLFEQAFNIEETNKIPFYKSQILIEEFLKFRFTKELDKQMIQKAIEIDGRLILPTKNELDNFFEIFYKQINQTEKLKSLNIEINFKEEIFNISEILKSQNSEVIQSIRELKNEIKQSSVSTELIEEWNSQLNEIFDDIKNFKAYTAKERLEKLEARITEQSVQNDKLFARLYYLKATCLDQIGKTEIESEHSLLLIKIYKLQPENLDYKSNAAHAYYSIKDMPIAERLSEELLQQDEFNIIAWVIKCYLANEDFKDVLNVVPQVVKSKNIFKINLFSWLFHKRFIKNVGDLENLDLCLNIDFSVLPEFSYKNMKYQHLTITYLLGKFFEENPTLTIKLFYEGVSNNLEFKYASEILKLSSQRLKNTEIEKAYYYYQFQYHCCSFILTQNNADILAMEDTFQKMTPKPIDVYIRMIQAYNSLQTEEGYTQAIQVGESYKGPFDQTLSIILIGNYSFVGQKGKQTEALISYIESKTEIDRLFFLNFISLMRFNNVSVTEDLKSCIQKAFIEKPFSKPEYEYLLKVFCFINLKIGDYNSADVNSLIEKANEIINVNDAEIAIHLAFAYVYSHQEESAKLYLRKYINKEAPSESLKLYCKILYNAKGDKIELLEILKNWRENYIADYELLQIEYELRRLQGKWGEAIKICKKALEFFSDSEFFINSLFISLNNSLQTEEIKSNYRIR